ncbi:MAG: c-type cytochrome [Chloroflexota bacterium]|nr:c-type cytochrome [Chloroflexota bacterium]MDE3192960.1 c-type cytochrome [Chloroflexota bacterium]
MPSVDVNTILAVVATLLFLALIGYFAFLIRHQEEVEPSTEKPTYGVELLEQHYAPSSTVEQPTPYYVAPIPASPDPLEIASNLDKKVVLGGALLFALFAMIGAYFAIQPTIRANAEEDQMRINIDYGKELFAQYCYDCHGRDGKAGKTPDGKTLPGLPLNKPDFKYANIKSDPTKVHDTQTLITNTITRGRPFTPPRYSMPAWGNSDGGPLSAWQVMELEDLIMYGTDQDWADIVTIRQQKGQPVAEQIPSPPAVQSGADVAKTVCTVCHTFDAGANSPNPLAPNLNNYVSRGPFNDQLKALKASGDPDWLVKWITNPPSVKPGTAMPPYGSAAGGPLSEATIRSIISDVLLKGQ